MKYVTAACAAFVVLAGGYAAASANWVDAVVTSASATADAKGFTISANVELPQPKACYDVQIIQAPIKIYPPQYSVQQRPTGKICTEVITPYFATQHFDAKPVPKAVNVYALDSENKLKHWILPVGRRVEKLRRT